MSAQPPTIQFGILKCRDLVQLYFLARMVVNVRITELPEAALSSNVLWINQDPSRIKYEIILANLDVASQQIFLATTADGVASSPESYSLAPGTTLRWSRDFLTDLDGVTMPVYASSTSTNLFGSARETFLTPAPIDEGP
jgi:hypothetical protein